MPDLGRYSAGHVILLNGTPSSGKTTIARALWQTLDPGHWYRSLDDFRQGYTDAHWIAHSRPAFEQLFVGFIRSVREMALAGHGVITEAIVVPDTANAYIDALRGLTVYLVGVRCPLEVAQQRERARGDRLAGPIALDVPDFDLVHAGRSYDVEFDTSIVPTTEAVARIRARIADEAPPTAFTLLKRSEPE